MGRALLRRLVGLVLLVAGLVAALVAPARPAPEALGHETADIDVRAITMAGLALGGLLLVVGAVTLWMGVTWTGRWPAVTPPAGGVADAPLREAPGPAAPLVPDPASVVRQKREQETAALRAWGWVDRAAGVAIIPVEVAMELIAERGLPRWAPGGAGEHGHDHAHPASPGGTR